MKVSLNWIRQFTDFELPPIDELVERIGAQLGAVETVENIGDKYRGVLIAKVVSSIDHPDSDHMHVCKIDDGGKAEGVERDADGLVQVVCGAPNVRAGLTVAWLPPGSTVPESVGTEPFVLGQRKLRGVMSNGMLASPRELALGDSHEGILEIDKDVEPGSDFAAVYKLDDHIIDIENKMFTHRPDCFGTLGVAREIAGILGHQFHSPDWYQLHPDFPAQEADLPLRVTNELPELVPRFSALVIADVQLGPSPTWLQVALAKLDQKSISNIVDLTNFYMLVTGQPLHAYDYDKVRALTGGDAAEITVRYPRPGEKIRLINGKEIEPRSEAMMIASGDRLIGIGGVMGGYDTEVDADTKNVILEAASFDMYNIRRTSMTHGLFTDAVTRFNKGQSPLQTLAVLAKITTDICETAGGKLASERVDINQLGDRQSVHPPVPVPVDFINTRLGLNLSAEQMQQLLQQVECRVDIDDGQLTVTAPFWRTDIELREDVIEEIGRLYGFDNLPVVLPRRTIRPAPKNELLELKHDVRQILSQAGANEVLTYSFVHGNLLQKTGQDTEAALKLSNALSPELQYYRLSLTASLLDKVHMNLRAGYSEFALFEIGKGHNTAHIAGDDGLPSEFDMLELVYARSDSLRKQGAAYYEARHFVEHLAGKLGLQLEFRPLAHQEDYPVAKPYDHARSAQVWVRGTDTPLGMVGEYKTSVRRALKLPVHAAGFGLGLQELMQAADRYGSGTRYLALPKFPRVTHDVTFKLAADQPWQAFSFFCWERLQAFKPDDVHVSWVPTDIYQSPDDPAYKQLSFRVHVASYERTLTDTEVTRLLDELAAAVQTEFDAVRI